MKKILRTAAVLFSLVAWACPAAPAYPVSSIIVMPWDLSQNKNLPSELKAQGVRHIVAITHQGYEADKAIYEVVYETRNRPAWVEIPMSAVEAIAPTADNAGHTAAEQEH